MMVRVSPRPKVLHFAWALAATLLSGYMAVAMEKRYLEHHPYFFDAVSYSLNSVKLYERVQEVGRIEVIRNELSNNNRNPLRTVPLIAFAPNLLAHPFGHMAITLLSLFSFIFLLAYSLYKRTGRIKFSIAGSTVPILLPGLYNPVSGIAVYWLDLTAALLVGSAVLALLNSNNARSLRWLALFVVLGSCAAFARYVSIAYLLFASAPVFILFLLTRVKDDGNWRRSFFVPALFVTGVGLLVAGPYLIAHVGSVSEFYSLYGYSLGTSIGASFDATWASIKGFIGSGGVIVIVLVAVTLLFKALRLRQFNTTSSIVFTWLFLSIPILLVFVLRTSATHTISYAAILFVVALVIPWASSVKQADGAVCKQVGLIALLVIGSGWGGYYKTTWQESSNPSPEAVEAKSLQTLLADQLAQQGQKVVWNAYFDEISWIPSLDAFYRHGVLPLPLGQDYVFSIHETVYKGNYPGWDSAQINAALLKNADTWLNIAVVFENPDDANEVLPNVMSRSVVKYISESIKNDPNWIRKFEINTVQYGRLAGYINLHSKPDNYELVLAGRMDLRPRD